MLVAITIFGIEHRVLFSIEGQIYCSMDFLWNTEFLILCAIWFNFVDILVLWNLIIKFSSSWLNLICICMKFIFTVVNYVLLKQFLIWFLLSIEQIRLLSYCLAKLRNWHYNSRVFGKVDEYYYVINNRKSDYFVNYFILPPSPINV